MAPELILLRPVDQGAAMLQWSTLLQRGRILKSLSAAWMACSAALRGTPWCPARPRSRRPRRFRRENEYGRFSAGECCPTRLGTASWVSVPTSAGQLTDFHNNALADLAAVHGNVADLTAALTDQR
jgi:hypothetical protein